jgi:hydrogenase nickel incorporation protein HypB
LNLVSSPGAGKTTLLTNTLAHFKHHLSMAAIVGDQYTDRDAKRLQSTGVPAVQINTGKMCHLDAHHIHHAIDDLSLSPQSVLWIENIGNLVCPALFDLGEATRVVLLSVTEGDDKPLKYPYMFQGAALLVINKLDLLPYVDFDIAACIDYASRINPHIQVIKTTAINNQGLQTWYEWLTYAQHAHQQQLANVGVSI